MSTKLYLGLVCKIVYLYRFVWNQKPTLNFNNDWRLFSVFNMNVSPPAESSVFKCWTEILTREKWNKLDNLSFKSRTMNNNNKYKRAKLWTLLHRNSSFQSCCRKKFKREKKTKRKRHDTKRSGYESKFNVAKICRCWKIQ